MRSLLSTMLALFCVLMPFEETLSGSFGSILKLIGIVIILTALCYIRRIRISTTWTALTLWIVYSMLSYFWANSSEWWFYFFRIYISQFAFITVLGQVPLVYIDLEKIKKGTAFGAMIAGAIIIFMPTTSAYFEGRRTISLWGAHINPNLLAAFFILGFYALLSLQMQKRGMLRKIFFFLAIGFILISMLYTGSRGCLIALIASLLVVFLITQRTHKMVKGWQVFLISFAVIILLIVILKYMPEDYMESRYGLGNILGLNEYRNGAHNRYTIWLNSWELFQANPIIGYGCGNFFDAIESVYRQCAAHNIVVLSAVENGILGSIPLAVFLCSIIKKAYTSGNPLSFGLLTAILIVSLTLDSLPYKYFWITLILVYWDAEKRMNGNKETNAKSQYHNSGL